MNETELRRLIETKYNSVRAFSLENGIPYTTMRSILERGIMNAKAETVFKICDILGIDPKSFDNDNSDESLIDLKDVLNRTVAFDGHTLDDSDAELIKSLLENMVKNKD
ncbi:TPA: helix-turn-helix domain-containing protein [Streptococcus suis]